MTASEFPFRDIVVAAVQQLGLATLLFLLLIVWLHIPDANALEVLLSVVVALLLAAVAGAGESLIALRLTQRAITARRLVTGAIAVLVAALLWYGISLGLEKLSVQDYLHAGYLNSRAPASMRNVFSYGHLAYWLGWFWSAISATVAGLLGALAFSIVTCDSPGRGLRTLLRSGQYWLALLLVFLAAAVATGSLMDWTPGHGLTAEAVSLAARLLLAISLDAVTVGFLLVAMAAAVRRIQIAGGAAPESSQPRTAEMP